MRGLSRTFNGLLRLSLRWCNGGIGVLRWIGKGFVVLRCLDTQIVFTLSLVLLPFILSSALMLPEIE